MSCDEVGNSGIVIQPTEPADVEALLTVENAVFETRRLIPDSPDGSASG